MAETLESFPVGEIDTSAPFESVRAAASHFGGFGFWKPSSHVNSQNDVEEACMVAETCELEKELIAKEEEALKILKSIESTKATVEELKSKLQGKENCDMNVLKELNQAKTNLCKTTQDLAAIRESVELLNKRLEEERDALDKTRDRLNSENAEEIQRLSHEAEEIEQTRNRIKTAEMRLVAARKMKEAARAEEAVAIAEIKTFTKSRRIGDGEESLQEEILQRIEETAQEIRSSRRTLEEGLEKVNREKMEEEERRRSSSCSAKYKNHFLVMNNDGTSSSVAVLKPTMSIGQILSKKLLLAEESGMMLNHRKVSLGQILGKTSNGGGGEGKEKANRLNGKRKRFGFAKVSELLNKDSKKNVNKKKKMALDLK